MGDIAYTPFFPSGPRCEGGWDHVWKGPSDRTPLRVRILPEAQPHPRLEGRGEHPSDDPDDARRDREDGSCREHIWALQAAGVATCAHLTPS